MLTLCAEHLSLLRAGALLASDPPWFQLCFVSNLPGSNTIFESIKLLIREGGEVEVGREGGLLMLAESASDPRQRVRNTN